MQFPEPIPVIILTGFLGSGKSTILNELLTDPAFANTAVIINEFGDVAIDHDLVQIGRRELMVTSTGCMCCTVGSDIRSSLFELHEAVNQKNINAFNRVIVETTGLADPAPVINQIVPGGSPATGYRDPVVARSFELSGVICTIDAISGLMSMERHFECMKQVAFADRIILTKTDLMQDAATTIDYAELRRMLPGLNPAASIVDKNSLDFDLRKLFTPAPYLPKDLGSDVEGWLAVESAIEQSDSREIKSHPKGRHSNGVIRSDALIHDKPVSAGNLKDFVELLSAIAGPQLLRVKGIVNLEDEQERPLVLHVVQDSLTLRRLTDWPSEDHRTRLVAITHGLAPSLVSELFTVLTGLPRRAKMRLAVTLAVLVVGLFGIIVALSFADAIASVHFK